MLASFEPDEKIDKIANAYALDAVDYADKVFRVTLDWTDGSVEQVESILSRLYAMKGRDHPSPEQVWQFAKMFGSYLGETYRRTRNHAAKWGMAEWNGSRFVAISSGGIDKAFWPWGRVKNRLDNGDEDNVWHYYKYSLPN